MQPATKITTLFWPAVVKRLPTTALKDCVYLKSFCSLLQCLIKTFWSSPGVSVLKAVSGLGWVICIILYFFFFGGGGDFWVY